MKKIILLIAIVLFTNFSINGQSRIKAAKLSNSISDLVREGKIDKAVDNAIKTNEIYFPYLINDLHANTCQSIRLNDINFYRYVEKLHQTGVESIKSLIFPIYVWSQSKQLETDADVRLAIENLKLVLKESNYTSRSDRYAYLSMMELKENQFISENEYKQFLKKCIFNLEAKVIDYSEIQEISLAYANAWRRFFLSYLYYDLYQLTSNANYLEKAAFFSTNLEDIRYNGGVFIDNLLISGKTNKPNYKIQFYNYLKKANKTEQALESLSEIAFIYPTENNIILLRDLFLQTETEDSFEQYWFSYFNSQAKELPQKELIYEAEWTGLTEKDSGFWILIDFWGTWCVPCLKELPELQDFYLSNLNRKNSRLKISTLSYNSNKLEKFMNKNNYTFPVFEVDDSIIKTLKIEEFPTKLLISPQGKYITLKSSRWRNYTENYMLFNADE